MRIKRILGRWLPVAVAITAMSGLVYLAVRQVLRHSANDPQIQMAEDAARALAAGGEPDSFLPKIRVDLAKSVAPFVIIYDDAGSPVVSSGELHGKTPVLPPGVFDYVRARGQNRITWQPERGVRIATVVMRIAGKTNGFVLAGRSLREIEKRSDQAELESALAWIVTMWLSLIVVVLSEFFLGEGKPKK